MGLRYDDLRQLTSDRLKKTGEKDRKFMKQNAFLDLHSSKDRDKVDVLWMLWLLAYPTVFDKYQVAVGSPFGLRVAAD